MAPERRIGPSQGGIVLAQNIERHLGSQNGRNASRVNVLSAVANHLKLRTEPCYSVVNLTYERLETIAELVRAMGGEVVIEVQKPLNLARLHEALSTVDVESSTVAGDYQENKNTGALLVTRQGFKEIRDGDRAVRNGLTSPLFERQRRIYQRIKSADVLVVEDVSPNSELDPILPKEFAGKPIIGFAQFSGIDRSRKTIFKHELVPPDNLGKKCLDGRAHHWLVTSPEPDINIGCCKGCGIKREFNNVANDATDASGTLASPMGFS